MSVCKDHRVCIETAVEAAEAICAKKRLRFTPLRRRVLELILAGHRPAKAYDLMQQMHEGGEAAKPPTVYRTLDFLQKSGLVHKLRSQDAYIACTHAQQEHGCFFLICEKCGEVTECCNLSVRTALDNTAKGNGFTLYHSVVELIGTCGNCSQN